MSTRRFPLRPSRTMYWAIPFFGGCAVALALELGKSDRLVRFAGHLGVTGSRVLFAVLGACSLAFVVLGILAIVRMRGGRLAVTLADDTIELPGSLLRPRSQVFRLAEITSARLQTISKQELLTISDARGKGSIARSHVGDAAFDAIVAHVAPHVPPPRGELPVATLR